mgnify:CR=1 FL=1
MARKITAEVVQRIREDNASRVIKMGSECIAYQTVLRAVREVPESVIPDALAIRLLAESARLERAAYQIGRMAYALNEKLIDAYEKLPIA